VISAIEADFAQASEPLQKKLGRMSPYLKVDSSGTKSVVSEVAEPDDIKDNTVKWGGPLELSSDSGSPIKVTVKDSRTLLPDKIIGTGVVTPRCNGLDEQTVQLVDKKGAVAGEVMVQLDAAPTPSIAGSDDGQHSISTDGESNASHSKSAASRTLSKVSSVGVQATDKVAAGCTNMTPLAFGPVPVGAGSFVT